MFRGLVDSVAPREVVGWAALEGCDEPLLARLIVDDQPVAEMLASELRPGTRREGWHPTGRCGFRFRLASADISQSSAVRVLVGQDKEQLASNPWTFGVASKPAADQATEGKGKLFFMHIPKTAGSALNELICGRDEAFRTVTHIENKDWWNNPALADDHDFLSGHVRIAQAAARFDLADFLRVTLLREPFAQFRLTPGLGAVGC